MTFLETPEIETIDIGGYSLIRSSIKNHKLVTVLTDPSNYFTYIDNIGKDMVLDVLFEGEKILPGQKIPMNSEIDLILGNGKR